MQKNQRLATIYFLLALGLISLFAYTLLFSAITMIRGYAISAWVFPAALVMMLLTQFYACNELFEIKPKRIFVKTGSLLLGIILLCVVFAHSFYDLSFDGQWYHQETVYQIKTGWNPYYKELPVPKIPGVPQAEEIWCSGPHINPKENPNGDQDVTYIKYMSLNYFAKGAEITEAAIYALTRRIETGKALNAMIMLASLFLCLSVLCRLDRWTTKKNWGIAVLFTCNPVTLYQLTSYCVDGLMASVLLCLLAVFILILLDKNKYAIFLFGLLILVAVNIKFTAIVFAGVFCLGFIGLLAIKKKWVHLKKILVAGVLSFLVGFVFIGFHPYMTNLISHNNVFYSLKETQEEIYAISPAYLKNKNRFIKFFVSYGARSFDKAANDSTLKQIVKMPFSFSEKEMLNANNPELEVAGFGPFFSGALILFLFLFCLLIYENLHTVAVRNGLYVAGVLVFSIFIIPDPWWARFAPQTWLLPCILLFLSEYIVFRSNFIRPALYVALSLNILWALSGFFFNILISAHINYQIAQLKTLDQPVLVEYCGYRDLRSNRIRFYENHIPFLEENVTGAHIYNVIHSNTRFETPEELPAVTEPFLMKMNRKYKGSLAE